MTTVNIDISGVPAAADFQMWALKKDVVAALKALRVRGLNVEDCVTIESAGNRLVRGWVVTRPDDLAEMTWLMREDGSWIRGRLCDGWDRATWVYTPNPDGAPIPATFTHVIRTVPDIANRRERYHTKSNGSCGRWVITDDSVAICTCGAKFWEPSPERARWAGRHHIEQELAK